MSADRVASMDELRATALGCTACRLAEGRTPVVFGGGGVTPDIEIDQSYLTDFEMAVERDGALFNFAVEYANSNPDLPGDWTADETVIEEFSAYLAEREKIDEYLEVFGLAMSDSLLEANAEFMSWGVRREITRKINGAEAADISYPGFLREFVARGGSA